MLGITVKNFALITTLLFFGACTNDSRNQTEIVPVGDEAFKNDAQSIKRKILTIGEVEGLLDIVHCYNVVKLHPLHSSTYVETLSFGPKWCPVPALAQVGETRYDKLNDIRDAISTKMGEDFCCLCLPEYLVGLSLYNQLGSRIGYIYLSKNHKNIFVVTDDGRYRDFRFDRNEALNGMTCEVSKIIDKYLSYKE